MPENPYGIGLFSSGQDRPGPPHKIRIPLGLVKILLSYKGFRDSFGRRATDVQQRSPFQRYKPSPKRGAVAKGITLVAGFS